MKKIFGFAALAGAALAVAACDGPAPEPTPTSQATTEAPVIIEDCGEVKC